jgi:hypothetical protein
MQSTLFRLATSDVPNAEKSLIVRAVGAAAMDRLFGHKEVSLVSSYSAHGGQHNDTLDILAHLHAQFATIPFKDVQGQIDPAKYAQLSTAERSLIERTLGTAFWYATMGDMSKARFAEIYRTLGGSSDNTVERLDALQPFFDRLQFN